MIDSQLTVDFLCYCRLSVAWIRRVILTTLDTVLHISSLPMRLEMVCWGLRTLLHLPSQLMVEYVPNVSFQTFHLYNHWVSKLTCTQTWGRLKYFFESGENSYMSAVVRPPMIWWRLLCCCYIANFHLQQRVMKLKVVNSKMRLFTYVMLVPPAGKWYCQVLNWYCMLWSFMQNLFWQLLKGFSDFPH